MWPVILFEPQRLLHFPLYPALDRRSSLPLIRLSFTPLASYPAPKGFVATNLQQPDTTPTTRLVSRYALSPALKRAASRRTSLATAKYRVLVLDSVLKDRLALDSSAVAGGRGGWIRAKEGGFLVHDRVIRPNLKLCCCLLCLYGVLHPQFTQTITWL